MALASPIVTLDEYPRLEQEHKMHLKDFTPRLYQESIFNTCTLHNTLVVLPTGIGKTAIFLMMAAYRLNLYPKSKILLLGPTRPLIEQYYEVFKKHFNIDESRMAIFTGFVAPEKRQELWKNAQIVFSTPQGLENDIMSSRISLVDVSLLGFDECHRSTGDYSYNFVAKQYMKKALYPRILGLTASPGSDNEKIREVCSNLFIEKIEIRTVDDVDVNPYVQDVEIEKVFVELPDVFKDIKRYFDNTIKSKTRELENYGFVSRNLQYSKKNLLGLQAAIHAKIAKGEKNFEILKSVSLLAEIMKIQHAVELLETQGFEQLREYMDKLQHEAAAGKTKATQNLVKDINFRSAYIKLQHTNAEHPKLLELKRIIEEELDNSIEENASKKIIIFSQYRNSGSRITKMVNDSGFKAKLFVGQAKKKDTGLSQKKQKEMLEQFSISDFNVLVSSSVGEEGLDIPQVDLVIFYEPVPSAIRKIQRSGRTGRLEKGKIIMLITKDTIDEVYYHVARNKEKRMYRSIDVIKNNAQLSNFNNEKEDDANSTSTLHDYSEKKIKEEKANETFKIIADYREKGSNVLKEIIDKNINLRLEKLSIGDFLLSSRVIIEYKTVQDFVDSIIDGRLLTQLKELKKYEKPILIIEGNEDIYSVRRIHPNAIRGMLITITVSYGIPIIQTKHAKETAEILIMIAKKEQLDEKTEITYHFAKPLSLKEQQEYFISALPNIGMGGARPLLKHFKSVKNIVNASEKELQDVDLIGPKKSKALKDVFDEEWKE
ncbi:TPA: DEAD/DEAH box helicase [Candidatus Woesearchaeota archaeon]|nr:DEAD/DEAH box helicase [Candidatus Woesearchaeota archaeon]HIJ01974.1 DEAD/DEAH box helicase [Candidatus Woesearchaeota archaeon]